METSTTISATRILVVDDHPLFRTAIRDLLSEHREFEVCGEAGAVAEAIAATQNLKPDLVVTDISVPNGIWLDLVKAVHAGNPEAKVLVLSMHEDTSFVLRSFRAGANGYVLKSEPPEVLVEALRRVLAGERFLSPRLAKKTNVKTICTMAGGTASPERTLSQRELEVFQSVGREMRTQDIAKQLGLSVKTVETHRARIKDKLKCKDSGEMVRFAIEWSKFKEAED